MSIILLLLIFLACSPAAGGQQPTQIPILTYHRFDPDVAATTTVTVPSFENQIDVLKADGYTLLPLNEVVNILLGDSPAPTTHVATITIDDGHRSVYTVLYPIIKQRRIPVTLFIYPSCISNASYALTWDQIREMQSSGLVDVQSHTFWHPNFRAERAHRSPKDYASFVDMQLIRSRQKLDLELHTHVDLLAWPYGIVDAQLEAAARNDGYRAAFAYDGRVASVGEDRFAIHRIPVPDSARGAAFRALLRGQQEGSHHAVQE